MKIHEKLNLVYDSMDDDRKQRISSFLDGLPLTVNDVGCLGSDELRVGIYTGNDFLFDLTPVERRVAYDGFGNLSSKKYEISFTRFGHERSDLIDQVFVGFVQNPFTGIFLRTGPPIYCGDGE